MCGMHACLLCVRYRMLLTFLFLCCDERMLLLIVLRVWRMMLTAEGGQCVFREMRFLT
jgi:hypothetical protein